MQHCFSTPTLAFVPETPLLNIPEAVSVAAPLLARFHRAGQEYARNQSLSPETIQALETPMLPKAEYLRGVNA